MPMTRKEREAYDAALERANLLAALRWTAPVAPDLPIPERGHTQGWGFSPNGYGGGRVYEAWSEYSAHGEGEHETHPRIASQGGKALYSTKVLALAALRHAIECEAAAKLLRVDRMLEEDA